MAEIKHFKAASTTVSLQFLNQIHEIFQDAPITFAPPKTVLSAGRAFQNGRLKLTSWNCFEKWFPDALAVLSRR